MSNKGICSYSDKGEVTLLEALGLEGGTALGRDGQGAATSGAGMEGGRPAAPATALQAEGPPVSGTRKHRLRRTQEG